MSRRTRDDTGLIFRRPSRHAFTVGISVALIGLLWTCTGFAQVSENQLKATFVLRATEFVSWPTPARDELGEALSVCLLGTVSFETQLAQLSDRPLGNGQNLRMTKRTPDAPLDDCHVVFLGDIGQRAVERVLARVRDRAILTVSELADFAQNGGIMQIRFERSQDSSNRLGDLLVRFTINVNASRRANLQISSRLLRVATLVEDGADTDPNRIGPDGLLVR